MMNPLEFLRLVDHSSMSAVDRARALLWWVGRDDNTVGMTSSAICVNIEGNGHPRQNTSRLDAQLSADRFVSRVPGSKAWRLHPRGRTELDSVYASVDKRPQLPKNSDSILPSALFQNTRGYIEKVAFQINASFDIGLYDCCAVMCRRLLETLIIEVYESAGRSSEIKGTDGHFFMLSELIRKILKDDNFNLGRNTQRGLEEFKKLGDLSAHNRRFNAKKKDIEQIKGGLRISVEELLHLAKLI